MIRIQALAHQLLTGDYSELYHWGQGCVDLSEGDIDVHHL